MMKNEIPATQQQYETTSQQSETVKHHNTSHPGQDIINQEMAALNTEYDGIQATANQAEDNLEQCILGLEEFAIEQAQFADWLDAAEVKVKTKGEPVENQEPESQLEELVVSLSFALNRKSHGQF